MLIVLKRLNYVTRNAVLSLTLLFSTAIAGVLIPRLAAQPAFPDNPEALKVKARAERLYADMSRSDGIAQWIRNNIIVQKVSHHNYQELPGSCSGFKDQPKADRAYDRYVDMSEIGLFGIQLRRWHAVCGGRIPLTRQVIHSQTKVEWEESIRSEQLEFCKKHKSPCGYMGDFREPPKSR